MGVVNHSLQRAGLPSLGSMEEVREEAAEPTVEAYRTLCSHYTRGCSFVVRRMCCCLSATGGDSLYILSVCIHLYFLLYPSLPPSLFFLFPPPFPSLPPFHLYFSPHAVARCIHADCVITRRRYTRLTATKCPKSCVATVARDNQ